MADETLGVVLAAVALDLEVDEDEGMHGELEKLRHWMHTCCEIKFCGFMGSGGNDVKERGILSRGFLRTPRSLEYKAERQDHEAFMKGFGVKDNLTYMMSPVVKDTGSRNELCSQKASDFRAMIAAHIILRKIAWTCRTLPQRARARLTSPALKYLPDIS